jgi:hypothetical protein
MIDLLLRARQLAHGRLLESAEPKPEGREGERKA